MVEGDVCCHDDGYFVLAIVPSHELLMETYGQVLRDVKNLPLGACLPLFPSSMLFISSLHEIWAQATIRISNLSCLIPSPILFFSV